MSLSVKELLEDRYKVINPYPNSPYKVGDLIIFSPGRTSFHITTTSYYDEGAIIKSENYAHLNDLEEFSNLFQKLEWWQERKPEEMPEYLKVAKIINRKNHIGLIFKAVPGGYNEYMKYGYTTNPAGFVSGFDNVIIECFLPATLEEYNAYQSSLNTQNK